MIELCLASPARGNVSNHIAGGVRRLSTRRDKVLGGHSNVAGNLSQQYRGDVPPLVERHRRSAAVRMTELLVSATLPDLDEAERFQARYHLLRLQHRQLGHGQATCTFWVPMNSDSSWGSPSSSSIPMTSAKFW